MLMTLALILAVLWIVGLIANVASGMIHLLLIAAIVLFAWHLIAGRKHTV